MKCYRCQEECEWAHLRSVTHTDGKRHMTCADCIDNMALHGSLPKAAPSDDDYYDWRPGLRFLPESAKSAQEYSAVGL